MPYSRQKKGFTLIEMIVTLSIFVLILLIATNAYVMINRSQRKVAAAQKIQDDVRYLMEVMSQDIRLSQINYNFYTAEGIDLHPLASTQPITILALVNQTSVNIFYRWIQASQHVEYCRELTPGICDPDTGTAWNDLTPNGVTIAGMRFVITPTANPFVAPTIVPPNCSTAGKPPAGACEFILGYSCAPPLPTCVYYSDGAHYQPKVRIVIHSVAEDQSLPVESRTLDLQSVVSSRLILGQVKNTYHD